jgi:hypothetical protein
MIMHPSNDTILRALTAISQIPTTKPQDWLSSAERSVEFLKLNVQSDRLVLFASMPCVLIHAVLAPIKEPEPA